MRTTDARGRRVNVAFCALVATAALFTGLLSTALSRAPGPLTGLAVAVSGAIVLVSVSLAARIMIAVDRARQSATGRQSRGA